MVVYRILPDDKHTEYIVSGLAAGTDRVFINIPGIWKELARVISSIPSIKSFRADDYSDKVQRCKGFYCQHIGYIASH